MNKKQIAEARAALASYYAGSIGQSIMNSYARGDYTVVNASTGEVRQGTPRAEYKAWEDMSVEERIERARNIDVSDLF